MNEHEIRVEPCTDFPPFAFRIYVGEAMAIARQDKDGEGLDEPYGTLAWWCGQRGRWLARQRGGATKRKERST